ncbi:MAG TPA: Lsr2 family protein [Pilimelia sp.]|nr:Lsr2 family protein [Pilimelia sp.]
MAKQVITVLTDDLDGSEADRTVEFGLDGVNYTVDLSDANVGKLRKALDPFIAVATRGGRGGVEPRRGGGARRGAAAPARSDRDQNKAIREWAVKNGYEVSERGRIPGNVVAAFHSQR